MAIVMSSSVSAHCWNARARPHSSSIMNVDGAEWLHCRHPMHAASLTKTLRALLPRSVGSCPTNLDKGWPVYGLKSEPSSIARSICLRISRRSLSYTLRVFSSMRVS